MSLRILDRHISGGLSGSRSWVLTTVCCSGNVRIAKHVGIVGPTGISGASSLTNTSWRTILVTLYDPYRYISRLHARHGWQVRLPNCHGYRFFPDRKHGSEMLSFIAAQRWRNHVLRTRGVSWLIKPNLRRNVGRRRLHFPRPSGLNFTVSLPRKVS